MDDICAWCAHMTIETRCRCGERSPTATRGSPPCRASRPLAVQVVVGSAPSASGCTPSRQMHHDVVQQRGLLSRTDRGGASTSAFGSAYHEHAAALGPTARTHEDAQM